MDTTAQVTTTTGPSEITSHVDSEGCGVSGGLDIDAFATENSKMLFWTSVVLGGVIVLLILLYFFGRLQFGSATTSTYTSTFVPKGMVGGVKQSNFGNYPNWYMQDGCAGYNCSVDTDNGRSLGFGVSNFEQERKSHFGPLPGVRQSNMTTSSESQRRAAEEILRKHHMEVQRRDQENMQRSRMQDKREHMTPEEAKAQEERAKAYIQSRTIDEVGSRQARVLAGCGNAWDPMASEEAKVLGAVGVYRPNTPGMSSFSRAINENTPLTDTQLEAIMQGGEPYVISPAGMQDVDALAAQQRQEQIMTPSRQFV